MVKKSCVVHCNITDFILFVYFIVILLTLRFTSCVIIRCLPETELNFMFLIDNLVFRK